MLLAGCLLALAGCTSLAPRYMRPAAPVSDTLPAGVPAIASDAGAVADLPWRQVFLDTRLQQVIALALENNRDLRIALLNIETQRAQYRIQRAASLPSIDASAAQSRSRGTDASGQSGVSRSASAWRTGWPPRKPSAVPA
jgi:multidrug efflux system outer membrane protein